MKRSPITRRNTLKWLGGAGLAAISTSGAVPGVSAQSSSTNWPSFRHNRANTGYTSVATGPSEQIQTAWSFETGESVPSSPSIVDGTVYVGSGDGSVYALSLTDGSERWRYEIGEGIASSPLVTNGTVYVGGRDNIVYALSAEDGSERWTYQTRGDVFSSPAYVDGTVVVGSQDNTVYALSTEDGSESWIYQTDDEIWSSPAISRNTVFIGSRDNTVHALSAEDGSQQWTYQTGGWIESSPAVYGGTVFVGSLDNTVYALAAADGTEQWSTQLSDAVASSPAVANGTVYVGCRDGQVYALNTSNGTQQWTVETGSRIFSSPAVASDTVYVGSADNSVYALGAQDGSERWRFDTEDSIFSSPAVVDGTVVIGSDDASIYALSSPSSSGISTLLPIALGLLGLGGGGAWLAYNRRTAIDERSQQPSTPTASDSESSVPSDIQSPGGGAGSTTAGPEALPTAAADTNQTSPTENDSPSETTVNEPAALERSSIIDRMLPEDIPTGPNLTVDYDTLGEETPIGSGGNADVTRATITTDDGEVVIAIKKPRLSGTIHTETIDQILTEAETWDGLADHDYIVDIIDYGSDPLPWIAMEYMDGGDLSERIGDIDTEQAIWTAINVTKGVHYAHRKGIAHLDLKPENVLFRSVEDAWDVPKVSDWGLAKELLDHSKSVEGMSPQYAAPEQFSDEFGYADDITDIYQLGIVFYELFTGRPPFEGSPAAVMQSVLEEEPTPPSEEADVPPELDDILLTALAREKADRYDSLVYLRDALQELYDERVEDNY